ncbi:OB-fold nucleic acid binding domain protein [uncultured archaeon]|nr:OB-fold nucleic acid binding domain protein [uncultured archaeon]
MGNKLLLIISLVVFLIGICLIIFLYFSTEPKIMKINEIDYDSLNLNVKIVGEISRLSSDKSGFQLLNVCDETGNISVFVENGEGRGLRKFDKIIITGRVQEYRDNFEIVADKINKLTIQLIS